MYVAKEAVTAERRYEKERHSVKLHACKLHLVQGRICSHLSLPSPSPPSHPPPINAIREASCVYFPPPSPTTYSPLLKIRKLAISGDLGQKRGRPLFRGSKVLQLNLDSFCDHVWIFGAVIGHLKAEIDFWLFPRKRWKYRREQIFGQSADILTSRAGTTAGTVRERRRPYKLGGLSLQVTWGLHEREATSPERELFSQTCRKSAVGDSAEPK